MLVFVYGTLTTGEANHGQLNDRSHGKCTLLGEAITEEKFPLVVASRFNAPFLLYEPGLGHRIHGELYEVDDEMLKTLDNLEYHPVFYERLETIVVLTNKLDKTDHTTADKPAKCVCWVYFIVKYQPKLRDLPRFESYTDNIGGNKFKMPEDGSDLSDCFAEIHRDYKGKNAS